MRKKFLSVVALMLILLVSFTNVEAADGLFSLGAYNDIYKLSEQANIDLPFINVFSNSAIYDKDIKHSGITIGESTIDVDEKLEGVQIIVANDMITVKGEVENALIYGTNVVIEGKITGDSLILSPSVKILETATIEKDIIIVANDLDLKGTVNGNVIATISETANISGVIVNDLRIITQGLTLENEEIKGDIYIETNVDTKTLIEKYPSATIKAIQEQPKPVVDWMELITKGIITVIIYSAICFFVTKKDNNVAEKAYKKFKVHAAYGLIISVIMIMLLIILPLVLILMAIAGFGLVAWPVLVAYLALVLLVWTTAMLIVGMTIFEAVKSKVGKYKIPVIALIYIVLYALTKITFIATYSNMAILLIALGIVMTMLTKKIPKEDK